MVDGMTQPDSPGAEAETGHGPIYEALKKLSRGRQDDYYRSLGRIAANFSRIDLGTTYLLKLLGDTNPAIDLPVKPNLRLDSRLNELRRVIPLVFTDRDVQIRIYKLADTIDETRQHRNELIHSIWYVFGRETGVRYNQKKGTRHLVPLEELNEFDTALERLLLDLLDLEESITRNRPLRPSE